MTNVILSSVSGIGRWAMAYCKHTKLELAVVVASVYAPNDHTELFDSLQDFFMD